MAYFNRCPVVAPIDFSDASRRSIRAAIDVAPAPNDVTVVYVVPENSLPDWRELPTVADQQTAALERLRGWLTEHEFDDVDSEVLIGDPGLNVADYAGRRKAGLIVMPSHGRHGLSRLLLGSVTERVVRHCECPVLVLRHDPGDSHASGGATWLPRKRVVVPIDFSPSSPFAVRTALEIVDSRTDVDAIHIVPALDHLEGGMFGQAAPDTSVRLSERQQFMERYLAEHDLDIVRAHAIHGDPGITISEYARECDADLIVIPSHGYQGIHRLALGSVAERVVRHAHCPVLVLRRLDAE